MASAKIVLNSAVDMAGADRGNMRCFEATGCGALMVSDIGNYPPGFVDNETMILYETEQEAVAVIENALEDAQLSRRVAVQGHEMISSRYSKTQQWADFKALVDRL
jgi:spore maturation protein CgeB